MKKILIAVTVLLVILICAGYFVGNYFVNFALKAPPPATADIADPNLKAPPAPNFPNEIWTITSADGFTLHATYYEPARESHNWAILVHGYGRNQTFANDYAEEYLKRGYNVLTPDLRGCGTSEGIYLTMGTLESRDVAKWAEKIVERDPQAKIILHGVSMGAATVMMTAALNPKNLVAVVEDCGYTSAYEMFTAQLDKIFGLPEFPIMPIVDVVSKIKVGVAISDAAPIESVKKISVPILFIHGDADKLVPYEMMNRLFNAATSPVKEKFTVEGAGHADAKTKNPTAYFDRVFKFLDSNIK
ncbi:MAG: alpha/beta hydrolase [Selenomonadaceae bacterium]|nr:alpha/beta hydrolase [Selenomonadaceae bacterium]